MESFSSVVESCVLEAVLRFQVCLVERLFSLIGPSNVNFMGSNYTFQEHLLNLDVFL